MECRITKLSRGGYLVQAGFTHKGGEASPTGCPGVTLPAFIVYESCHCDTQSEATVAAARMKKKHH